MHNRLSFSLLTGLLLASPVLAAKTADQPNNTATFAYAQGRLAYADADYLMAGQKFQLAINAYPDDMAMRRALDTAMLLGDKALVARLSSKIPLRADMDQGSADTVLALSRMATAASAGDWAAYEKARQGFSVPNTQDESAQLLQTLLAAWGKAGVGEIDAALALVAPTGKQGFQASYLEEHRAYLLSFGKRWPEALEAYERLLTNGGGGVSRLRLLAVGAALEASLKDPSYRAKAMQLLEAGGNDPQILEAKAKLNATPNIAAAKLVDMVDKPTDGLSLLFLRASVDLARARVFRASVNFARLGSFTDPNAPEGWLILTEALAAADEPKLALEALAHVPNSAIWRAKVDQQKVALFLATDRVPEARQLLQQAVTSSSDLPSEIRALARLGEFEISQDQPAAAIAAFDRAIAKLPANEQLALAELSFRRGMAHSEAKDWAKAEADYRKAIELQGQNAGYLNNLGYSLLERGEKLAEARALISKAYAINPNSATIVDSMGWVEFVSGNYAEAVRLLEQAQKLAPQEALIADHLGDAYWRSGQRIAALHVWASAEAMSADAELSARLQQKQQIGLPPLSQPLGVAQQLGKAAGQPVP